MALAAGNVQDTDGIAAGVAVASTVDSLNAGAGSSMNREPPKVLLQCCSVHWCHGLLVTSLSCAVSAVSTFPSMSKHR